MPVRGAAAALILPVPWLVSRVQESASQPERIPVLMQIILFAALLLAAAWIDYQEHIIPDILNLGIALSAFCVSGQRISGDSWRRSPFLLQP